MGMKRESPPRCLVRAHLLPPAVDWPRMGGFGHLRVEAVAGCFSIFRFMMNLEGDSLTSLTASFTCSGENGSGVCLQIYSYSFTYHLLCLVARCRVDRIFTLREIGPNRQVGYDRSS